MSGPSWLADAVFYQVMPDRFAREAFPGQASAVPLQDWSSLPGRSGLGGREFFGGNLRGLTACLDHIRDLGADAILLTPINRAPSYHRYDTTDFRSLDPLLGTWDDLSGLLAAARARALRLVFDIALNHVSREHPWFQRARQDPDAPERGFFRFLPDGTYGCWRGHGGLPELQLGNPALQEELFLGPGSVLDFWLRLGFAGVRLDCANDLTLPLCRSIVASVRERFPEAAVIGELVQFPVPWLDVLDGAQTYFFHASINALRERTLSHDQFRHNLRLAYATGAHRQFQMLSSHDMPRARTGFGGDADFLRAARRLQFTLPGIPMIYYGEEFDLAGGRDPDNRGTIPWDLWSTHCEGESARELRALSGLRRASPELARGLWESLFIDAGEPVVAFFRALPDEPRRFTLVVWNDAPEAREVTLTIPYGWLYSDVPLREVFSERTTLVRASLARVALNPHECSVWQIADDPQGVYSFFKDWSVARS